MIKRLILFITGGLVLLGIVGGLIAFIVINNNTSAGVTEFTLVDTWKCISQTTIPNYDNISLIHDEYFVFHDDSKVSYYKGSVDTPTYDHISYSYEPKNGQKLYFPSIDKSYTLEKKSNNIIRLVTGNTYKDYIRYHGDSFTHIEVPDNLFTDRAYSLKYRETTIDYSGQYLEFKNNEMTLFNQNGSANMGPYAFTFENKVLKIPDIGKELNIYPVNEKEILMVEAIGRPGSIWELLLR